MSSSPRTINGFPSPPRLSSIPSPPNDSIFDGLSPPGSPSTIPSYQPPSYIESNVTIPEMVPSKSLSPLSIRRLSPATTLPNNIEVIDTTSSNQNISTRRGPLRLPDINVKKTSSTQPPISTTSTNISNNTAKSIPSIISTKSIPSITSTNTSSGISSRRGSKGSMSGPDRKVIFKAEPTVSREVCPPLPSYESIERTISSPSRFVKSSRSFSDGLSRGLGSIENSIEDQLSDYGYITQDRIVTRLPNGEVQGRYMKTVNTRGQTVYVEPDRDGFVGFRPSDLTVIETTDASKIPVSVRVGTYECAGMDVYGVAFECDGEVCTLTRSENNLAPQETVFHIIEDDDKIAMESGSLAAYPIVRMSEIMTDSARIALGLDEAIARIRNASYRACQEDIKIVKSQCDIARKEFYNLNSTIDKAYTDLGHSIRELEKYRADYDKCPPSNEKQQEKVRILAFNLRKRHDMMVDLTRICHSLSEYGDQMKMLTEQFVDLNQHIKETYKGLDQLLDE